MHQWAAYFQVKDKQRRLESELLAVKILKGISEIMSTDPDPDFNLKKLFPDVEFSDQEISVDEITPETTMAMISMSLGGALPRGGGA